jgi:hypothetical protein
MVSRREKLSRSFLKLREQILEKQLVLLADDDPTNQVSSRRRSFLKLRELLCLPIKSAALRSVP